MKLAPGNKIDRNIIFRLFLITIFVLIVLIFIFIIIDFSQNSDQFTDHGATISQILLVYYFNYIPEIIRLVTPVAVFVATLLVTGQLADRLEIVALKAAGVSLYRLSLPYFIFAFLAMLSISYLDGFIVPKSNAKRIAFERTYLDKESDQVTNSRIYRQDSRHTLLQVSYFDPKSQVAYKTTFYTFKHGKIVQTLEVVRLEWNPKKHDWRMVNGKRRIYSDNGYHFSEFTERDTTLNLQPQDLARSSADVYQLTYPEIVRYIHTLKASGAENVNLPEVQFYSKLCYPFSIIVVTLIGLAIAYERRRGGRGVHIAYGLAISFLYLVIMKLSEPFGISGSISPALAAVLPHLLFLFVGLGLYFTAKK